MQQEKPDKCFAHDEKFGKQLCTCLKKLYCQTEDGGYDYPSCHFYKTRAEFREGQRLYPPREPLDQYKKYQRRSKNETTGDGGNDSSKPYAGLPVKDILQQVQL